MSEHESPTRSPAPSDSPSTPVELTALSLLDMPLLWLEQLQAKGVVNDRDDLALLRTCTFMRGQVLGRRTVRATFQLPMKPDEVKVAQAKLLLAIKYSSNVHLGLEVARPGGPRTYGAASVQMLLSGAVATAGHALDAIRSARLEHAELDALVPSWLGTACPQLEALTLVECRFIDPNSTFPDVIPGSAQLQHLELRCYGHWPTWWQQMNSLPGLTSLTLHRPATSLRGCPPWLTELSLLGTKVNDENLQVLLSMPRLARVTCEGFRLQHSYSDWPCSWAHLEVEVLDVEQFDRLPLHGLMSIHMQAPAQVALIPSHNLATCTRVAAAVAKCGGIKTTSSDFSFGHHDIRNPDRVGTACLVALLPILASLKIDQLVMLNATIDAELLTAIGQHLAGCGLHSIDFARDCKWALDAWPMVLPSLPATVSSMHIEGHASEHSTINEITITAMCVTAPRPMAVTICLQPYQSRPWDSGWEERLAAAMASAGHEHVAVTVNGSR